MPADFVPPVTLPPASVDNYCAQFKASKVAVHEITVQANQIQALELDQAARLDDLLFAALQVPEGMDAEVVKQQFNVAAAVLSLP